MHAGELGLSQKDVVDNVITALNSNLMIAPNYWVDRKTGNDYFLTVQYFENGQPAIHDFMDLKNIPLRGASAQKKDTGCGPVLPDRRWQGTGPLGIRRRPLGRVISNCPSPRLGRSGQPILQGPLRC